MIDLAFVSVANVLCASLSCCRQSTENEKTSQTRDHSEESSW